MTVPTIVATFTESIHRQEQRRGRTTYPAVHVQAGDSGRLVGRIGRDPYRPDSEKYYLVELPSGQVVAATETQVILQ